MAIKWRKKIMKMKIRIIMKILMKIMKINNVMKRKKEI